MIFFPASWTLALIWQAGAYITWRRIALLLIGPDWLVSAQFHAPHDLADFDWLGNSQVSIPLSHLALYPEHR